MPAYCKRFAIALDSVPRLSNARVLTMDYLILLSSIVLGAVTVFAFRLDAPKQIRLWQLPYFGSGNSL